MGCFVYEQYINNALMCSCLCIFDHCPCHHTNIRQTTEKTVCINVTSYMVHLTESNTDAEL